MNPEIDRETSAPIRRQRSAAAVGNASRRATRNLGASRRSSRTKMNSVASSATTASAPLPSEIAGCVKLCAKSISLDEFF